MSLLDRFVTRSLHLGEARAVESPNTVAHHAPPGALGSVTHLTVGQPIFPDQDGASAVNNVYLRSLYAYRCANAIASKITGLEFKAGNLDTRTPRRGSPLGSLLGTDTGAPCPGWSTKMMWRWSSIQYMLLGKCAWALEFAQPDNPNSRIVGMWPLLAQYLNPLPNVPLRNRPGSYVGQPDYITQQQQFLATYQAQNQTQLYSAGDKGLFSGFRYQYPGSQDYRQYKPHEVAFLYRPSQSDIRKPESVLQAAGVDINVHTLLQAFDYAFLKNGAVPATVVVTPPFASDPDRQAFRSQFMSEFGGPSNRGKAMFAEREIEPGELPGEQGVDSVEIKTIGTTQRDAQLDVLRDGKIQDICVAMGVPLSILGDSTRSKFCVDVDTEVLTRRGWLTYDQVREGDHALTLNTNTELAEWQPISNVSIFPGPAEVVRMEGGNHSSVTTPNHRWPVSHRVHGGSRTTRWSTTETLTRDNRLYAAAPVTNLPEQKWSDAFVELVAWAYTEGHFRRGGALHIGQSSTLNPRGCSRIRSALVALLGPARVTGAAGRGGWTEHQPPSQGGMTSFYVGVEDAKQLHGVFEDLKDKVPTTDFLVSLTQSQLELFIAVSIEADGSVTNTGTRVLSQSVRGRVESFQLAALLSGQSANVRSGVTGGHGRYAGTPRWYCGIQKSNLRQVPFPAQGRPGSITKTVVDTVWCPTTPNATWLARRNGFAYFTGNTNMQVDRENFWETISNNCSELQDSVNTVLAPRVGPDKGWFDLTSVPYLKPTPRFSEQWGPGLVAAGIITKDEFRGDYELPPSADVGLDDGAPEPVVPDAPPVDIQTATDPLATAETIPTRSVDMLAVARLRREAKPIAQRRRDARHAGPDGHQHVPTGHATTPVIERLLTSAVRKLMAEQETTVRARMRSRRGRSLSASDAFDPVYWVRRTTEDLAPLLGEAGRDDTWIARFAAGMVDETARRLISEDVSAVFARPVSWEVAV